MRNRSKKSARMKSMVLMAASVVALSHPTTSWSQDSNEAVLSVLRECAKIEDSLARLNCYDSNIRPDRSSVGVQTTPDGEPLGAVAPGVRQSPAGNFGAESVKSADRFKSHSETGRGEDEIRTRILNVREREPGVYLVTIEDGAQWLFAESVPMSFRPPRKDALVAIKRASLGSFLMVVDGQAAVRVRRLK